jgi:hypothetical protein
MQGLLMNHIALQMKFLELRESEYFFPSSQLRVPISGKELQPRFKGSMEQTEKQELDYLFNRERPVQWWVTPGRGNETEAEFLAAQR